MPRPERRSLTHVGGETATRGDPALARILADALAVHSSVDSEASELASRAHVHGFHTYPARMHPDTARRLIAALSVPGATVLDPFCGSGTVLVEARALGRRVIGVDLNPLAARLAARKVAPADEEERAATLAAARDVAALATDRRKQRAGSSRPYGRADVDLFDPHVLLELDGLRLGIEQLPPGAPRDNLLLVLSSILVKLSKRAADTSSEQRATRIAAGYPARHFLAKTRELTERLAEAEPLLSRGPPARIVEGDARDRTLVPPRSVDLVVSSPPYAGVYDYLDHHRMRLRWLGLHDGRLERGEIGARRDLSKLSPDDAWETFFTQLGAALASLREAVRPGGHVVLLIADATRGTDVLAADELVTEAGTTNRFAVSAVATQRRPHYHGPVRDKLEHAILLTRTR